MFILCLQNPKADMVTLSKVTVPRDPEQKYTVTSGLDLSDSNHNNNGALPALPFRDPMISVLSEQTGYLKTMAQSVKDKSAEDVVNGDWSDIAIIMDRVFLAIYVIVIASTMASFFNQATQES